MKEIGLTQGKVALVDDEDFEYLSQFNWHATKSVNTFYASRKVRIATKRINITMHWEVMNGKRIDHDDHNGLNNQKLNLRFCTSSENGMNRIKNKNASSIYKGVSFDKESFKWKAQIRINGNGFNLGRFSSEIEAARVYNAKAIELFGEFANINTFES